MLTRSFWRFPTTALRRYVATLPRPTDTVAEELSDVSERRTPTEVIEIVRKARNESEIRRALGLDRTTAVKLFLVRK